MDTKTLTFGESVVEVTVIDNIIYMKALNLFTNETIKEMTRHLDTIIDSIPANLIRIWDSSQISSERFKVTSQYIKTMTKWAQEVKERRPGSTVYFIAKEPAIYGSSRMYELRTRDEKMDVIVLKSIDELPDDISIKLPT